MKIALKTVTSPENMLGFKVGGGDPMKSMFCAFAASMVGERIIEELYDGKDEVVITEDQFSKALTDGLNIEKLSQDVDGKMTTMQLAPIGILCALTLKYMIPILFGDKSENA